MRGLGRVAIVGIGLVVVAWGFSLVVGYVPFVASGILASGGSWPVLGTLLVPVAAMVGAGLWLVAKRDSLSVQLFGDEEAHISADGQSMLRVGIVILGLGLVLVSIPRLLSTLGTWASWLTERSAETGMTVAGTEWPVLAAALLTGALQLAAGIYFLRSSEAVAVRLWAPAAGTGETESVAEANDADEF